MLRSQDACTDFFADGIPDATTDFCAIATSKRGANFVTNLGADPKTHGISNAVSYQNPDTSPDVVACTASDGVAAARRCPPVHGSRV